MLVDETEIEMQSIRNMMEAAAEYGLESEVVWEFYQALKTPGRTLDDAIFIALCEWDL